ncbi:hypothetical protein MSP8887_01479 [Marinomonas spartinae]|uniref:hypothetical protein n=1 Tax=Marinomonas spartinae TaxID=1792290 RepID=UPI000808F301|nr:hypothetical protein [Marinomonas spartinae]SBS31245.1 hypothetical protein MSP8887_01479 [Marinomonas spartinae]
MKPITPDCVVFYSATSCRFYDIEHIPVQKNSQLDFSDLPPSENSLAELQSQVDPDSYKNKAFALIVLPDEWLSSTEQDLDYAVPKELASLAALACAAEKHFSPPETLWFHYQVSRHRRGSHLAVLSCHQNLVEQVCCPFKSVGIRCCVVSFSHWNAYQSLPFGLFRLQKQALLPFEPDRDIGHRHRIVWLAFFAVCVALNVGLLLYDYYLNKEFEHLSGEHHQVTHDISLYDSPSPLLTKVLAAVRALPERVRLSSLKSYDHKVFVALSLSTEEMKSLLARWQTEFPDWQLNVQEEGRSLVEVRGTNKRANKEVINVGISISSG